MGCQRNVVFAFRWFETGHIAFLQQCKTVFIQPVIAHLVEYLNKGLITLAVHMGKFHIYRRGLLNNPCIKKERTFIVGIQQFPVTFPYHRRKLKHIAYIKNLNAAKRSLRAPAYKS